MKSRTITHFLKTGDYSGAEKVAITIILEMRRRYEYRGIYVSLSGDINEVLKENHIEHAIIAVNSRKEYQRVIDTIQPDIIHAHDFGTSVIISRIKTPALKISHLHNNPPWIKKINVRSLAYLWASKEFRYLLAVSNSIFEEYIFEKRIRCKAKIIGNPVDINKVRKNAEEAQEYVESDIIFLGRFSSPKNPLRFLDIVNECKKRKKDIKAIMVGKGELKDEIKESIRKKGLNGNVKVVGFKSNPYGYLKHAKVLCVPSNWEGFGLVVIEAFALGVPVVGTPVGGMKNLITEKVGNVCSTVEEFQKEIIALVTDERYYTMKSQAAYDRGAKLDSFEQYMGKMYEYYNG